MLKKEIEKAFNDQMNAEMYSAYLYLSMAAHFESRNLGGFAQWMKVQAQEEMVHAMKFYAHVNERGGRVLLGAIDAPPAEWATPLAAFQAVLKHEQKVTALIGQLVKLARKAGDEAAGIFLQWFVTEQVEEEASADDVVQKLKLVKDTPNGLFLMDQQLGQRVFVPPPAEGQ